MVVCTDLDGTLSDYADQLGPLLRALRADGHTVTVLTGWADPVVDQGAWDYKAEFLRKLGLADCYDNLVVVAGPVVCHPQRKTLYMRMVGASILIDNSEANARAATAAGVLVLVPWGTRVP